MRLHTDLPVEKIAGTFQEAVLNNGFTVVTAAPGAGKSTFLPLVLLEKLPGRILMLEPRRLAARQIAERMASLMGEKTGETVGYRVRMESRIGKSTRIEVLTEGILTRMIIDDPTLDGVSAVIFDEFHERSLICDEALALVMETRNILRDDLRLIIMSATIDAQGICKALDAAHIDCEGRCFEIRTSYAKTDCTPQTCVDDVTRTIGRAIRENPEGDLLAFLPGEAEIRRCEKIIGQALAGEDSVKVYPLYGMLSPKEQKDAIAPSKPGERKIVLATPVAETSITIEGVTIVVDSGLYRKSVFNPKNALSQLVTERISKDMADQRRGRAGRTAPGVCYRLWTEESEKRMKEMRCPEILEADLSPAVLDVAVWNGGKSFRELFWIDAPAPDHIRNANTLLEELGATNAGEITEKGRKIFSLPCHPRLASMLAGAESPDQKSLAADLAALLEEKDILSQAEWGCNIVCRVEALRKDRRRYERIEAAAAQYRKMTGADSSASNDCGSDGAGILLAAAFPERIARQQDNGRGHYLLATGEPGYLAPEDGLTASDWIVVAAFNVREGAEGRILLAAPVDKDALEGKARKVFRSGWDSRTGCIVSREELRIGKLLLDSRQAASPSKEECIAIICDAARKEGLSMFDFNDEVQNLQRRIASAAFWHPELDLPKCDTESILKRIPEWLPFFVGKSFSSTDLKKIDLCPVILSLLDYGQQQDLDAVAPEKVRLPGGREHRLEYRQGAEAPIMRVRLQECFGLEDTPKFDRGSKSVLMELLSPGFKPVQLTSDLRSFWSGTYFEVRKELKRRYPKHRWPDNPMDVEKN